jgi:hypothetical protein
MGRFRANAALEIRTDIFLLSRRCRERCRHKKKVSIDNKKRVFVMTKKQRGSFKKIVRKLRFLCDYENITDFFLRRVFSLKMLETSPVNVI